MKGAGALTAGWLLCCGCRDAPSAPAPERRPPVVKIAPVPTQPFEDGYRAGDDLAQLRATPRSPLPEPAEIERLAREQAAGRAERTPRWQRGFAEGYADGFRKVVTGQK